MKASDLNRIIDLEQQQRRTGKHLLELSRPFGARFAGRDGITGREFGIGAQIRMLDTFPVMYAPVSGFGGWEVVSAALERNGRFVDEPTGDGDYTVVGKTGKMDDFSIVGGKIRGSWKRGDISPAQLKAQKLAHAVGLIKWTRTKPR